MPPIRMVDLRRQHRSLREPIEAAVREVLEDCDFVMGRAVAEFEAELSRYLGVGFAVGCASGTDALRIALMALEIGPGDEVVTTPFSFAATVETIVLQGARPVFADIDPRTYNLDPGRIGERITSRTKAILPVHLFGHPADMAPILALAREKKLRVIEDAAQAVGARYRDQCAGTLGDIGCLSFYPAKHLGACGDGGALLTNDPELARKCRMIGLHGSERRYRHEFPGLNSRLDTLQAAILKVKLPHLESWIERRIRIAKAYDRALEPLPRPRLTALRGSGTSTTSTPSALPAATAWPNSSGPEAWIAPFTTPSRSISSRPTGFGHRAPGRCPTPRPLPERSFPCLFFRN